MTSVEFLKNELQIIAKAFPNVHIKYGFNDKIDTHIVELLPLIEYTSNKNLDQAWVPISIKFMETFEKEEVAFISSDSSLSLKEVIFEFNADACREDNIISEIFSPFTKQFRAYSYTFPTCMQNGVINDKSATAGKLLNEPVVDLYNDNDIDYSYSHAA